MGHEFRHDAGSSPDRSPVPNATPRRTPEPPSGINLIRLQRAAGNRAVVEIVTGSRRARTVVQRQIDDSQLPGTVLPPQPTAEDLRAYLASPVNRHHQTFTDAVTATINAFPTEAERIVPMWDNVGYFVARTDPLSNWQLDLWRRYLVSLAAEVNKIHKSVSDEVRGVVGGTIDGLSFDRAAQWVLEKMPLAARSLSLDVLWSNVRYFVERLVQNRIDAHDLALCRKYVTSLVAGIKKLRPLVETETRMGFEIETGDHFIVKSKFRDLAESLVNVTLATTNELEFLIDDIKHETKVSIVQIEFRTRPFKKTELAGTKPVELRKKIENDIKQFPVAAFGNSADAVLSALVGTQWTMRPALERLAPGLCIQGNVTSLAPKPIQHVTHSIPLSSFLKLSADERNLLIPGSGGPKDVEGLLEFFLTTKIIPQVTGGSIQVTTRGRNKYSPNIKTGLDTIAGFLPPKKFDRLMKGKHFSNAPGGATIEKTTGAIEPPTLHEGLPPFPSFNVQEGRAYLSAEEKLKPVLFDPKAEDIRVLVEHRSTDLVRAVNKAMSGQPEDLKKYLAVFKKLDGKKGDGTFQRWFQ